MPKTIKIKADCMDRLVSEHGFIKHSELVRNENLKHIDFVGFYKPYMNNTRYYTYIDEETRDIVGEIWDKVTFFELCQADFIEVCDE